jgi:hypothetical protein
MVVVVNSVVVYDGVGVTLEVMLTAAELAGRITATRVKATTWNTD